MQFLCSKMFFFLEMQYLFLCFFCFFTLTSTTSPKEIGIIGAGYSGSSAAYFLSELSEGALQPVVFEKGGHGGGRVADVRVEGCPLN